MTKSGNQHTQKMPLLFLGHGSPMNALASNSFTLTLNGLGKSLPRPKAILCISAHWMTQGSFLTHEKSPKTIHDFGGFPKELYQISYPAEGEPKLAENISYHISSPKITLDEGSWGLDHGTWSVLKHLYPAADIPVIQLSLDMTRPPEEHFKLGEELRFLRQQGVLIVGSGNIVHNLRQIDWNEAAPAFDWAQSFDELVKEKISSRDFSPLFEEVLRTKSGQLAVPTLDHYLPLLYILGASEASDAVKFPFVGFQHASISMRCVQFGV